MTPLTHALEIDPEFHALCPALSADETTQLAANLQAEGCREPLIGWHEPLTHAYCKACDTVQPVHHDHGRWACDTCGLGVAPARFLLLDGHNRHTLCERLGLPYEVQDIADVSAVTLATRADALTWIINNQLGRRNLTSEQVSYLRGKRYNLEKTIGHGITAPQNGAQTTAERLAKEYGVGKNTIQRDGTFAEAVDTLETEVRPDIPAAIMRPAPAMPSVTKKQVAHAGKLVQTQAVEPAPFMQREGWKPYHVLEAIEYLGMLPKGEHASLNDFLNQPFIPGDEGVAILANLAEHTPAQRQQVYTLWQSEDPRDQTLAKTLAAKKKPAPDPQSLLAARLIREVDSLKAQLRSWTKTYPQEPWIERVLQTHSLLTDVQNTWHQIASDVDQHHTERTAAHGLAFGV